MNEHCPPRESQWTPMKRIPNTIQKAQHSYSLLMIVSYVLAFYSCIFIWLCPDHIHGSNFLAVFCSISDAFWILCVCVCVTFESKVFCIVNTCFLHTDLSKPFLKSMLLLLVISFLSFYNVFAKGGCTRELNHFWWWILIPAALNGILKFGLFLSSSADVSAIPLTGLRTR